MSPTRRTLGPPLGECVADERTFEILLGEFRRVGVDPDTFSAMLALRPEDALRALRSLPDAAGPAAFLAQLRKGGYAPPSPSSVASEPSSISAHERRRRDKTA